MHGMRGIAHTNEPRQAEAPPGVCAAVESAHQLATRVPAVPPHTTNEQLRAIFQRDATVSAVAVVDGDRPIGLINRRTFMESYARPFAHDLWGRKSCGSFMERNALLVDAEISVAELARRASAPGSRALEDGFIITEQGRYLGHGSGPDLMRALSAIEANRALQIQQSIAYASLIQRSLLLSSDTELAAVLPDHALIWGPRDVVGGDCYWFRKTEDGLLGAVLDCTGHGVPGAFMTLIALSSLEQAFRDERSREDPGLVLSRMNVAIKSQLHQGAASSSLEEATSDDGLDGVCFSLAAGGRELRLASAHFPVMVRDAGGKTFHLEGPRVSVGHAETSVDQAWPTKRIALCPGAMVVMASDGCADQIGGPKRTAFGRKRLCALLEGAGGQSAPEFARRFRVEYSAWEGAQARRDDMMMFAFRVGP